MALEKSISTKFGVSAEYWRIVGFTEVLGGPDAGKADYTVAGYSTKTQRDNNKDPLEMVNFMLTAAYKDNMTGAYNEIKQAQINGQTIFKGSKDV
jgi:hypothetical protein